MKKCKRCGETKPLDAFGKHATSADKLQYLCRKCASADAMAWNKAHPERFSRNTRKSLLKQRYGLLAGQYEKLVATQGGRCAICGRTPERLDVDHCHVTKRVRGLLCQQCNSALGLMKESAATLRAAACYIEQAVY